MGKRKVAEGLWVDPASVVEINIEQDVHAIGASFRITEFKIVEIKMEHATTVRAVVHKRSLRALVIAARKARNGFWKGLTGLDKDFFDDRNW